MFWTCSLEALPWSAIDNFIFANSTMFKCNHFFSELIKFEIKLKVKPTAGYMAIVNTELKIK